MIPFIGVCPLGTYIILHNLVFVQNSLSSQKIFLYEADEALIYEARKFQLYLNCLNKNCLNLKKKSPGTIMR